MYPHPPECSKTKGLPSIKSRTPKKFNEMDDNLKSHKLQDQAMKESLKPSSMKKGDPISLSPLRTVPGVHKNSSCDVDNSGENQTFPGCSKNPDGIRTAHEHLVRSESFSKYKPLPAINDKEEGKNKISNKRTFESWSSHEKNEELIDQEKDDLLLDTIKKMKLGTDVFVGNEETYLQNARKNPFERDKSKEKSREGNLPSTSSIDLIIRLPDGERVHHSFSSADTLGGMVEFLSKIMDKTIDLKTYVIYTNEVPKRELKNRKSTLVALGVQDKSVLALDTRDLPDKK